MYIGKTLKKMRKKQGLKLSDLAELTGIQPATLSRIENQKMRGTVESHMKIARALSIDITQLYQAAINEDKEIPDRPQEDAVDIFSPNEKSSYEILTPKVFTKKMLPTLLQVEANGKTNIEQSPAGSEKFIYVLEGDIDIIIEKEKYSLRANHSLYFEASLKHYFINQGAQTAKILCVVTPVTL